MTSLKFWGFVIGMGERKQKAIKILWSCLIGLISSAVIISISQIKIFGEWEAKTYDFRMQLALKSRPTPKNVVMFYVDEPSLTQMKTQGLGWPWPRELYPMALDFCRRGGAKAVVFDLFFSEASVYGVDDDLTFAQGLKEGPPSYFVLFLSKNDEEDDDPRTETVLVKSEIKVLPAFAPKMEAPAKSFMSLPVLPLPDVAHGFGNAALSPDSDGVYRDIELISSISLNRVKVQDKNTTHFIPSLGLKVAADVAKVNNIEWEDTGTINFGNDKIPLDNNGRMLINYYGDADTFPNYPLARVYSSAMAVAEGRQPELYPSIVKDKIVIIGVAAPGLYDLKPTPISRTYPGPEVHATIIENILTGDFIKPAGATTTYLVTIVCGLLAALAVAVASQFWTIGLLGILLVAIPAIVSGMLFRSNYYIPLVAPLLAILSSSFFVTIRNFLTEGRKKRAIRKAFGQYLSPHVVATISKNPEQLKLGGEVKELTLFFSDIADFTSISEQHDPSRLVKDLNKYFSLASSIIQTHEGTLDKYIGDAIMAFWGAPLSMEDHAMKAVLAAIEIQKQLKSESSFTTRIGIHTGLAVVGNIGSDVRFNYTAIGDTVNLASRLEGLNKKFGTSIVMSENTYRFAKKVAEARLIGRVRVKGRNEPVSIYEPLGPKGDFGKLGQKIVEGFDIAMDLYTQARFAEACQIFTTIHKKTNDKVSLYYKESCERYMQNPDGEFDGVTTFTSK